MHRIVILTEAAKILPIATQLPPNIGTLLGIPTDGNGFSSLPKKPYPIPHIWGFSVCYGDVHAIFVL